MRRAGGARSHKRLKTTVVHLGAGTRQSSVSSKAQPSIPIEGQARSHDNPRYFCPASLIQRGMAHLRSDHLHHLPHSNPTLRPTHKVLKALVFLERVIFEVVDERFKCLITDHEWLRLQFIHLRDRIIRPFVIRKIRVFQNHLLGSNDQNRIARPIILANLRAIKTLPVQISLACQRFPNLKQSASKQNSLGITLRTLPTRLNCRGPSAGLTSPGRLTGDQG